jgi:hypothetical protein
MNSIDVGAKWYNQGMPMKGESKNKVKASGPRMPDVKRKSGRRKSLAELNVWLSANYGELLEKAKRNCMTLTGKPTFGSTRKRKSA